MADLGLGFAPEMQQIYPDAWTKPFWDATREHRLVICACSACGAFRMPPTPFCWKCRSREVNWVTLPGTGVVYTFTVTRHAFTPASRGAVPYVVGVVSLDGAPGARLITDIVGVPPEDVHIGMKVEVVFDDVLPEVTMPRFRPAPENPPA